MNQGIGCSINNLGKVTCEAGPALSLAGDSGSVVSIEGGDLAIAGKPLDRYQKILATVFLLQLCFCLGMCWYANYKEEKAKADLVTQ